MSFEPGGAQGTRPTSLVVSQFICASTMYCATNRVVCRTKSKKVEKSLLVSAVIKKREKELVDCQTRRNECTSEREQTELTEI